MVTPMLAERSTAGLPLSVADQQLTAPSVVFDRVSFAFDEHIVLHDVSFSVPKGATRILLGASGAGKSVLLKLILGLLRPDSGVVMVNGREISTMPEAAGMSCLPRKTSSCAGSCSRRSRPGEAAFVPSALMVRVKPPGTGSAVGVS